MAGARAAEKSTSLRRLGLESILPRRERISTSQCLPVFIELKSLKLEPLDLKKELLMNSLPAILQTLMSLPKPH
jgi:hypothetical protein